MEIWVIPGQEMPSSGWVRPVSSNFSEKFGKWIRAQAFRPVPVPVPENIGNSGTLTGTGTK